MSQEPERRPVVVWSASKLVLLVGVIMIILAAFGVEPVDDASLFALGVGVSFASFLVP